jgi:hypothetical protein
MEWIIFISILIVLGVVSIFLIKPRKKRLGGMRREDVSARWKEIEGLTQRGDEMSLKLAILEADKLLDHALKAGGFPGKSLGERLKVACYKYPKLRNVWRAHLLRNKLVHEASFHLARGSAYDAINEFHRALNELGLLR